MSDQIMTPHFIFAAKTTQLFETKNAAHTFFMINYAHYAFQLRFCLAEMPHRRLQQI